MYIYIYIRVCVYVCVCVSEVHGIRIHIMNDFLPTHLASSDALGPAVQVPYSERLFQALAATTRRTHSETKQQKKNDRPKAKQMLLELSECEQFMLRASPKCPHQRSLAALPSHQQR